MSRTTTTTAQQPDHVALLRGINVGTAKRVAMADLRAALESLGFTSVKTLLNSGNAVFHVPRAASRGADTATMAADIEAAVNARSGVSSRTIVLTAAELRTIMDENPIADAETNPSRFLVNVVESDDDLAKVRPLLGDDWGTERLALGSRAFYLWCPDGISASQPPIATGRALRDRGTARNWATMTKLRALLETPASG